MAPEPRRPRPAGVLALVPAGGLGVRLARPTPKQFLRAGGRPLLVLTARRLAVHPAIGALVVAVPAGWEGRARRLLAPLARRGRLTVVTGGATRQESVWRALQAAPPGGDLVLVHDAVRPFVTRQLVDAVLTAAAATGAALCALPVGDTVKRVQDGLVTATLDRAGLWTAQTPQAFRTALLREAHQRARRDGAAATDDAMLVERLGHPVRVVAGSDRNIKITTPADLRRARAWLRV